VFSLYGYFGLGLFMCFVIRVMGFFHLLFTFLNNFARVELHVGFFVHLEFGCICFHFSCDFCTCLSVYFQVESPCVQL